MAQHDYVIANATGATVRADINSMALAISSNNSGSSEPATMYAYEFWVDSGNNLIKLRNAANNAWITLPLSTTASNTIDVNGGAIDGTPIGASSASTGAFTTLSATGAITGVSATLTTSGTDDPLTLAYTGAAANVGPVLKLYRNSGSAADDDATGEVRFIGKNDAGSPQDVNYAQILTYIEDASDGTEDGAMYIKTMVAGTIRNTISLLSAAVVINDESQDVDFRVESNGNANMFTVDGATNTIGMGIAPDATTILTVRNTSGKVVNFTNGTDADLFVDLTSGVTLVSPSTGTLAFGTSNVEKMRLNSAGNLGIGTTSASARVHSYVADNDKALSADGAGRVNLTIESSESGGQIWYFRTAGTGNYGSAAGDLNVLNAAGTAIMTWDYSASTINGDFVDTSDVGLKENIIDITDATTKIKALKPRNFDWKETTKANGVDGFIAQEVETVLPNNVFGDNYDAENPEHGSKAINTTGLLAVAIKAIQELEARITTLEG